MLQGIFQFMRVRRRRRIESVPLEVLTFNPFQPRGRVDERGIDELAKSIREVGVLQPIVVRKLEGGYEVVCGERRVRACQKLELKEIPAVVGDFSDADVIAISLLENIQRQKLTLPEEMRGFEAFYEAKKPSSLEALADQVGRDVAVVAQRLSHRHLPLLARRAVALGLISEEEAEKLKEGEGGEELRKELLAALSLLELRELLEDHLKLARERGYDKAFQKGLSKLLESVEENEKAV